jgi:glycosyltransferase involved in cell wall biosynthesis
MEWIILDDGLDKVEDIFMELTKGLPNIRYIALKEKINIGAKRNLLNKEAKGDIIVCIDDDDYYPPERVAHVVTKLMSVPKINLAGSSELYVHFNDTGEIYKFGPYGKSHATNGTMGYKASYGKTHFYDESLTHAEEKSFLEDYIHPMVQLDPLKTILVMSHSENTFDKKDIRDRENHFIKHTKLKLKDFVKDKKLRDFYSNTST